MNFENLQEVWKAQQAAGIALPDNAELLARVKRDSAAFDAVIRGRDRRELRAGLRNLAIFALGGLVARNGHNAVWPFAAAVAAMAVVVVVLPAEKWLAQRQRPAPAKNLAEELDAAAEHLRRQVRLLRNVWWWYILPAQTGWMFFFLGVLLLFTPQSPWVFVAAPWLLWILWKGAVRVQRLNQDAVRKTLAPRLAELEELRRQLAALAEGGDRRAPPSG